MKAAEALKHRLKLLAGLPPKSPRDKELELIIQKILPIRRQRIPTESDWKAAAMAVVPGAGTYKYAGAATFCHELGGTREFQVPDTRGA